MQPTSQRYAQEGRQADKPVSWQALFYMDVRARDRGTTASLGRSSRKRDWEDRSLCSLGRPSRQGVTRKNGLDPGNRLLCRALQQR
jgi:hypothetical protein